MTKIEEGMILVSSYGYNCTLVNFYRVKRVSASSVWLQKLESRFDSHDGYGQVGELVPSNRETLDKPFMRRKQHSSYNDAEYIRIDKYEYAYIWDGKPAYYNSMD